MNNWQLLILLERFAVLKDVHKPKESEPKINHSQSKLWLSLQAQAFGRSWVWVPTLPYTRCWSKLAFFFFFKEIVFIYFWLYWVFSSCVWTFFSYSEQGLLPSCSAWTSHCGGFSCGGAQTRGAWISVFGVHGLSCSVACGIFPDQEWNLCSHPALTGRFSTNEWAVKS